MYINSKIYLLNLKKENNLIMHLPKIFLNASELQYIINRTNLQNDSYLNELFYKRSDGTLLCQIQIVGFRLFVMNQTKRNYTYNFNVKIYKTKIIMCSFYYYYCYCHYYFNFKVKFRWEVQKYYYGIHGYQKKGIPKINLLIHQIIILDA